MREVGRVLTRRGMVMSDESDEGIDVRATMRGS